MAECFCCNQEATRGTLCQRCYEHCNQTDCALWVEKIPSKSRSISAKKNPVTTLGERGWVTVVDRVPGGTGRAPLVGVTMQKDGKEHWAAEKDLHTTPEAIETNLAFLSWLAGTNENYWEKFYEREREEKRQLRRRKKAGDSG